MSDFLLMKDVTNTLRVSERTIYRYIDEGELHAVKSGKAYLFTQEDIERFIAEKDKETQRKRAERRARRKKR